MARKISPDAELLIAEYESDKLYGTIQLKYEAGRLVLLKREETIKPSSQTESIRGGEDER
jgi:hypothetical protein